MEITPISGAISKIPDAKCPSQKQNAKMHCHHTRNELGIEGAYYVARHPYCGAMVSPILLDIQHTSDLLRRSVQRCATSSAIAPLAGSWTYL